MCYIMIVRIVKGMNQLVVKQNVSRRMGYMENMGNFKLDYFLIFCVVATSRPVIRPIRSLRV